MSFSARVKDELVRLPLGGPGEIRAELAALLLSSGRLDIGRPGVGLNWESEGAQVARRLYALLRKAGEDLQVQIRVGERGQVGSTQRYRLNIPPQQGLTIFLEELGLTDNTGLPRGRVPLKILSNPRTRRAYLRGFFLGRGSISNPESAYYLELLADREEVARGLEQLLFSLELVPRRRERRDFHLVYLNRVDDILAFLNLTGAHQMLLDVESNRVFKEMKETVNRRVNWETANLEKTIKAGLKQMEDIRLVALRRGLNNLPPGLQDIASLRVRYPHLSLQELGQHCRPPVGKSGVNHRLRRLSKIADEIRREGK